MRTFWVLVRKELKELLTPQILAPFAGIILVFIALGNVIGSTGESVGSARVTVVDSDLSAQSATVVESLDSAGLDVTLVQGGAIDDVVDEHAAAGTGLFVELPEGFGEAIEASEPGPIAVRTVMTEISFFGMKGEAELRGALAAAGQQLMTEIALESSPDVPLAFLQQPLAVEESVTIGDKTTQTSVAAVSAFIGEQTVFIPLVLFIVVAFAAQLIATTIATEKENKTLETLLSYPISRTALVTAKMFAAGFVSLLAAGAYILGMQQYLSGLDATAGESAQSAAVASREVMQQLGLSLGPSDFVMLGLSLFAGILVALAIALILGAFAESVKAVSALITPLMALLMVPYLLTMFVDLDAASPLLKWGVLAIPFAHPFLAAQNLFLGKETEVWLGIGYQMIWFTAFALIAARIFSSDRILTMKLNLRRTKGGSAA